jgi:class 3 adenylate cyclase
MSEADLVQRNRELELIFQIDRLRDATPDESELIGGITSILLSEFEAELCILMLAGRDDGTLAVRSIVDKRGLPPAAVDIIREDIASLRQITRLPPPEGQPALQLIAGPLIVQNEYMGAVVVGRAAPFDTRDERLLHAAVSQIDSAIVHSRSLQQLRLRNRELELIYAIDRIRDQERDLDVLLQRVLTELCTALSGEFGFIALYDEAQETRLQIKITSDSATISSMHSEFIYALATQAIERAAPIFSNTPQDSVRSLMAVPLILREKIIGVAGALDSKRLRGFSDDDRRLLAAIVSQLDTAILERKEQRRLRALLARAVDPKVLEHLLERTDVSMLMGERIELTALFADLRGSTAWEEQTDPDTLVSTLNRFYERMTHVIFAHGGTLDKFAGDQVIALFGTPLTLPDHAQRAASAAIAMQTEHQNLQADLNASGLTLPAMGIGINSGKATAGEFGARLRTEFTAIGPAINLCARLCGAAAGGDILVSERTQALLDGQPPTEPIPPLHLKGVPEPVQAYRVVAR